MCIKSSNINKNIFFILLLWWLRTKNDNVDQSCSFRSVLYLVHKIRVGLVHPVLKMQV